MAPLVVWPQFFGRRVLSGVQKETIIVAVKINNGNQ